MPSWKKVIISGSDAALNSLDITQDLTVDTNTLHVDSSNNRVGIGTINPTYQLHVSSSAAALGVYERAGGAALYLEGQLTQGVLGTVSTHPLLIAYNSAEVARFTGTSFDVTGSVNITGSLRQNAGYHYIDYYGTKQNFGNFNINSGYNPFGSSPNNVAAKISFEHNAQATYFANDIVFATATSTIFPANSDSTTERVRITQDGDVNVTGSLNVGGGNDISIDGGGNLETNGGNVNTSGGAVNTNGGNVELGTGALNGTIPGSAVNVDTVTATVKNFVIDHPTPEKEGYKLRHSSLEGPEIGVYFRGKSTSNIIDLPDYWVDLVEEESITVSLTSFGSPCQHYIEDIRDNQVIIGCACGTPNYHFTVYGERKDVEKLVVEYKEEKYL